jgi:hypothetical protein
MARLKAKDFEILRGIKACGRTIIPLPRKPVRVATLLDENAFNQHHLLVHHKTVFLEDQTHDWNWHDGQFRYYTRIAQEADVLIVYELEKD